VTHPPMLVVGATGTLGSRLVRQLAEAGINPRALVRTPGKAGAIARLATPIIGDLLDPASLVPAFRGIERVFIVGKPTADMQSLERNAIDAAVAAGAKRIVYLSNFTARIGSELPPNHIHGLHEQLVASLDIDWTILGPTRYMTSMPFNWASVINDGVLLEAGGSGIMTCIDPEDVAAVAVKVLTEDGHEGQTYRLTSEDAFTATDLARLLSKIVGHDLKVYDGDVASAPMAKYFAMVRAGLYVPTDMAGRLLGRAPRSYARWLQDNVFAALRAAS
jgi:uncharacterized protein YbjT (DUF2867 family)